MTCPHSGYVHETVYRERLGFGIFNIEPHISHCTLIVSGPVGLGASVSVRPTSVDQPKESEYLSCVVFNFDCRSESRILRLRLPFFFLGVLAAMGLMTSLGVDVFNDFASLIQVKGLKSAPHVDWFFQIQRSCSRMMHEINLQQPLDTPLCKDLLQRHRIEQQRWRVN